MPIAVLLTMYAKPGKEEELAERFTDILGEVRSEPGNLLAITLRDPNEPGKLYEFAIYKDEAAIEAHKVAEHSLKKGPPIRELFSEARQPWFFQTLDGPEYKKVT